MLVVWVFFIAALYKMITHYVVCTCRSLVEQTEVCTKPYAEPHFLFG